MSENGSVYSLIKSCDIHPIHRNDAADRLENLHQYDSDTKWMKYTIRNFYTPSYHTDVFDIPEVTFIEGHFLFKYGYKTIPDVAESSVSDLLKIPQISTRSRAIKIRSDARHITNNDNRTGSGLEFNTESVDTVHVQLKKADTICSFRQRLSDYSSKSDSICLFVTGRNTELSSSDLNSAAKESLQAEDKEKCSVNITIIDRRRNQIRKDLQEMSCTAANYTKSIIFENDSIPNWLTGSHFYRRITPPEEHTHCPELDVLGLHRYHPISKSSDSNSYRLYDFVKEGESDKGMLKSMIDVVCRRLLRDSRNFDYVVPFPSHDGGYSEPLKLTAEMIERSTPIEYHHLIKRHGKSTPQKELTEKIDRWNNAEGSINVKCDLKGSSVVLLDDICTSGASLTYAAHELFESGASDVLGLVYGLNTGWGNLKRIKWPGLTVYDIRLLRGDLE